MVFVGADLLIMPPNLIDKAVLQLAMKGISRDQVLFSATHSHSSVGGWGPGFIGEQFAGKANISSSAMVNQSHRQIGLNYLSQIFQNLN